MKCSNCTNKCKEYEDIIALENSDIVPEKNKRDHYTPWAEINKIKQAEKRWHDKKEECIKNIENNYIETKAKITAEEIEAYETYESSRFTLPTLIFFDIFMTPILIFEFNIPILIIFISLLLFTFIEIISILKAKKIGFDEVEKNEVKKQIKTAQEELIKRRKYIENFYEEQIANLKNKY